MIVIASKIPKLWAYKVRPMKVMSPAMRKAVIVQWQEESC